MTSNGTTANQTAVVFGGSGTTAVAISGGNSSPARVVAQSGGLYVDLTVQPQIPAVTSQELGAPQTSNPGTLSNIMGSDIGKTLLDTLQMIGEGKVNLNNVSVVNSVGLYVPAIKTTNTALAITRLLPATIDVLSADPEATDPAASVKAFSNLVRTSAEVIVGDFVGAVAAEAVGLKTIPTGGVRGAIVAAGTGVGAAKVAEQITRETYNALLDKAVQDTLMTVIIKGSDYVTDVRAATDAVSKFVPSPVLIPTKIEYGFGTTPKPTMPSQPNLLDAVNKVAKVVAPIATIATVTSPISPLSTLLNAVKGNIKAFQFGASLGTKLAPSPSATATKAPTVIAPAQSITATMTGAIAGQLAGQQANAAMSSLNGLPNLNYGIPVTSPVPTQITVQPRLSVSASINYTAAYATAWW